MRSVQKVVYFQTFYEIGLENKKFSEKFRDFREIPRFSERMQSFSDSSDVCEAQHPFSLTFVSSMLLPLLPPVILLCVELRLKAM